MVRFKPIDWVYDLETYPNICTFSFKHLVTGTRKFFEVSQWKNDLNDLMIFLRALEYTHCRLIGFNNIGFDYPIIHDIMMKYGKTTVSCETIYNKAQSIIDTPWDRRFDNVIWDNDVLIPQLDLYKINHFDNEARRTSLKMLEFNMRSNNIRDLPFTPGLPLTAEQAQVLRDYNDHDVDETEKFAAHSIDHITYREYISEKYNRNFMNHNDTKIGKDYFIMELERLMPGCCYDRSSGSRQIRQTKRTYINLKDVILPYIKFNQPEFQRIKKWFESQTITETKGVFTDVHCEIDGFSYHFGTGGIHGSIDSTIVHSDNDHVIFDWDVASYYPNLAIANNLYPEHLSSSFCKIYKDVYEQRKSFKKGTPENAMLKLALNGVYGDSNNKYSPFYDPQYTMAITINGQLLLCLLAEQLMCISGLSMIQINTDGLTVKCPRQSVDFMKAVCAGWEQMTGLTLESAIYSRMFIRDVNNYIAEYDGGGVKRKGAYEYNIDWHQNHSMKVVAKAVEQYFINDTPVEKYIKSHSDIHDFMLRTKVGRKDKLMLGDEQIQNISRYYVSYDGGPLVKISPPVLGMKVGQWKRANNITNAFYNSVVQELQMRDNSNCVVDSVGLPWDERINTKNQSKYTERKTSYHSGWLVSECNDMESFNHSNLNYEFYIAEAKKLINPLIMVDNDS